MNRLPSKEVGSSLIEVVVALFVLAIGMLGVLSMQVKSMQFNQSAYYYTQAVYLANQILENMRSSPGAANTYLIGLDESTPSISKNCSASGVTCTPAELRNFNLKIWRDNVSGTLVRENHQWSALVTFTRSLCSLMIPGARRIKTAQLRS